MDARAVLAAYDTQVRRNPAPDPPDGRVERDEHVVRVVSPGWAGVVWCDLGHVDADAAVAAQVDRFATLGHPWEWKHYSHDLPADLPARLVGAGFTAGETETLLVADLADLRVDVALPDGVELRPVTDGDGVAALVSLHDEVFGGDHSAMGAAVLAGLARRPAQVAAVLAYAGGVPVSGGRVEFQAGTDFASLWGGGTVAAWRGRGLFRAVVAHRAALAADRGFGYLQVDAMPASRPILERLGFVPLAATTPFTHPGGRGGAGAGQGRLPG